MITAFFNSPIKRKLMIIMLLTSGVVIFVTAAAFIVNETLTFRREIRNEMLTLAAIVSNNTSAAIMFNDQKAALETLSGLSSDPRILAVHIVNNDGAVFAEYIYRVAEGARGQSGARDFGKPSVPYKIALAEADSEAGSFWNWPMRLTVAEKIIVDGREIGKVVIQANLEGLIEKLKRFFFLAAFVMLVVSLLAYMMSTKLQSLISVPIMNLAQTMKDVSQKKNYSIRSEKTSNDEIGVLIDGFNEMLQEIEERDETLKQRQDHLQRLAHFDSLTSLPNRALYCDRLSQTLLKAVREKQQVAVLFVDLDHFKDINDTLGHRTGDLLLKDVAVRLQKIIRASDTVARMGGDEFTIFQQDVKDSRNAGLVAKKIVESLSQPYLVEGREIFITASVGITMFPDDGATVDELLRNADTAMYHAKDSGKDMFKFFTQEMNVSVHNRLTLQNSLRRALERDEFILYYQPKMDIASRQVTSVEALLRWLHPQEGMILPGRFIPQAEETGLIIPIGEWVLRTACQQIKEWQAKGHPSIRVAVNVSASQFKRQNLAETVTGILEETGISPLFLELELTESAIMQNIDSSVEILNSLKAMGIQISIDDFGTGYSSLSYLRRFPIDYIKIDRSFIVNFTSNSDDRAIVTAIIAMARSLGLKIIAEGVETEEQLAILSELGCHEMQGYLYSKPLPPSLLFKFLRVNSPPGG